MELAAITVEKILEMFVILLLGVIAFRTGIVDSAANKRISGMLLKIVSPAMIFMSYQIDFQPELVHGLIMMAILSSGSMLLAVFLSLIIRRGKSVNMEIERMSIVYSNCGFIGVPLISGILGQEGVFYMSVFITVYNMFFWSHGLAQMSGTTNLKTILWKMCQPATFAIILGLICFLNGIRVPAVLGNSLQSVGNMNTPIAMLVAGCTLAESDLLGCMKRMRTYWISFLKLIVVPALTLVMLALVPVSRSVALTVLVGAACPTGAMTTMLALQFNKDSNYASELFTITTVLSLVTIPVVILLGSGIL